MRSSSKSPSQSYWAYIGLKAGKTIPIGEAKKCALRQKPLFRTGLLEFLKELESVVRLTLMGEKIVEKGRPITLRLDNLCYPKVLEYQRGNPARIADTEPSGIVKVTRRTKIEILLRPP